MKQEPFIRIPNSLLETPALYSLSANGYRLIWFLMRENQRHGGHKNGALIAPYNQLVEIGITRRLIGAAIEEVVGAGLVAVKRGIGRRPNTYALKWLCQADSAEPEQRSGSRRGTSTNGSR